MFIVAVGRISDSRQWTVGRQTQIVNNKTRPRAQDDSAPLLHPAFEVKLLVGKGRKGGRGGRIQRDRDRARV